MLTKLLADNFNPFKGNTIVQLSDAKGELFLAKIHPLNKIDLSFLPEDQVLETLLACRKVCTPMCIQKTLATYLE